ncbi:MAG: CAP domain-containing protein [Sandaracinus sp.]|nr:CAP domain-containing protein [Sandaracinus sp.]MCB9619109.1 CAP domain-containing protein [Sandaracinus sp.]MCB9632692.1 CAP domain-containing protein [Sandaracinus sp.]
MRRLALVMLVCGACGDDDGLGGNDAGGRGTPDAAARTDAFVPTDGSGPPPDATSPTSCEGLTQWEQKMLEAHNRWRAEVEPPAEGMLRVRWDRTIAANAAAWVASCDPKWPHSPEASRTDVGGYDVLGENLSYCGGTGCADDPSITDGSGRGDGEGWWEERLDYEWATDTSRGVTSHYTQMVSSNVYAIGCATQRCDAPGPGGWDGEWWWTICQYGPRGQAYWTGTKPYERGEGGLVEPSETVFDLHPGLCRERLDP